VLFRQAPELALLRSDKEASIMASLYDRRALKLDSSEEVVVITMDNFCREHAIDRIDLLKLDVEGHELAALQGAAEMLARGTVRFVQFEFGGCNLDSRTNFRDFWELLSPRYAIYRVLRKGLYQVPFYSELDEIFTTVNFLAERRY